MPDRRPSPMCPELRSKKWYFLPAPPRTASELLDASNHCWCARTASAVGADGMPTDPDDCVEGRACWRPPVSFRPVQA